MDDDDGKLWIECLFYESKWAAAHIERTVQTTATRGINILKLSVPTISSRRVLLGMSLNDPLLNSFS